MEARSSSELVEPTYHATQYGNPEEQSVTFSLLNAFEQLALLPAVSEDL